MTARTPGTASAATRTTLLSDSELIIPHNSTVPSWTMTLTSDGQVNSWRSNCAITFSRNVASSTVTTGFIVFPIVAFLPPETKQRLICSIGD